MTYHKKVIELQGRTRGLQVWSFWDFIQPSGNNPIEEWQNELSDEGRFLLDGLLKNNCKVEDHQKWLGFRRLLKGKQKGIWELEFRADKRAYRVIGKFGRVRKQAILLLGCYHKGKVYTPPDALETAYKRATAVDEGRAEIREREIRTDF